MTLIKRARFGSCPSVRLPRSVSRLFLTERPRRTKAPPPPNPGGSRTYGIYRKTGQFSTHIVGEWGYTTSPIVHTLRYKCPLFSTTGCLPLNNYYYHRHYHPHTIVRRFPPFLRFMTPTRKRSVTTAACANRGGGGCPTSTILPRGWSPDETFTGRNVFLRRMMYIGAQVRVDRIAAICPSPNKSFSKCSHNGHVLLRPLLASNTSGKIIGIITWFISLRPLSVRISQIVLPPPPRGADSIPLGPTTTHVCARVESEETRRNSNFFGGVGGRKQVLTDT